MWVRGVADNGSGHYSCAVAACACSSGHTLGAGLLSHEGGCRAWHSFAVRGLLDPVKAPGCTLGKRTGSDPGGAAKAVPHKRLAMLVHGASHPDTRVFRSLVVSVAPVGAGARMDSDLSIRLQDRPPLARGPSACLRACRQTRPLGVLTGDVSQRGEPEA